jgi:hypothetical protein
MEHQPTRGDAQLWFAISVVLALAIALPSLFAAAHGEVDFVTAMGGLLVALAFSHVAVGCTSRLIAATRRDSERATADATVTERHPTSVMPSQR